MRKVKKERDNLLRSLNPVQKEAVEYTDGPSLILAGAGSGKTKVLTHKIAYLIDRKKIEPFQILALTFTNKAAREMSHRITQLIGAKVENLRCGTFHSFFAGLLRRDCEKLGFSPNFAIYDEKDQLDLIKLIISVNKIGFEGFSPTAARSKLSQLKNKQILPHEFTEMADGLFEKEVAKLYPEYQKRLKQNNAMDFDDLLLMPIELFQSYPATMQYYQNFWNYILVDEYQDTNYPQYVLLKMLSAQHRNLSVVGDDDQSIYRWRGANIGNILEFEKDFPECKIFRLEQNYRSTANILAVANSIIAKNTSRMEKELWTKKESGEPVTKLVSLTGDDEALIVVAKIQQEVFEHKRNFSDFAILYRTNAQSRVLEAALRINGISYVIVAGTRFYERKEIKDILAYLRVVVNPLDEISLRRIINYPLRGIGETTIEKLSAVSVKHGIPLIESIRGVAKVGGIQERTKVKLTEFNHLIMKYHELRDKISAIELATTLVEELDILRQLKEEGSTDALNRRDNILELLTEINTFSKNRNGAVLSRFLEEVALITDVDNWDYKANAVTLMTLHSAKGLEFPVVFIVGLEEGLLPLKRNLHLREDLEEERRLFYVGSTRAKEKLYLSYATQRYRFGENLSGKPSQFLNDIKKGLLVTDTDRAFVPYSAQIPRKKITFEEKEKTLRKGAFVKHPRFGKGVIKKIEGDGKDQKAIIIFEELGEKKIVIQYANLEIL